MKPLKKGQAREDFLKFMSNLSSDCSVKPLYFKPFQCPVAIASAAVTEKQVQDYSVFALLLLRLIKAGFGKIDLLVNISGMGRGTVLSFLNKAIIDKQCGYIDKENPEKGVMLLPLGEETLKENESAETNTLDPQAHVEYSTSRKMHIEALTGTVIPSYMERYMNDAAPDDELGPYILPRENTVIDSELSREINTRLAEYVGLDRVTAGDIIQNIHSITSERIFFRWAYLVKLEGMIYPMIVMTGKRSVEKLNVESKKKGNFGITVLPVAVARSDAGLLQGLGEEFRSVLVREDNYFDYLVSNLFPVEIGDLPAEEVIPDAVEENPTSKEESPSDEAENPTSVEEISAVVEENPTDSNTEEGEE